jgi:hypothetical protein
MQPGTGKAKKSREQRLLELLAAARHTPLYRHWVPGKDEDFQFDLLPHVEIGQYLENPKHFVNRRGAKPKGMEFRSPLSPAPRTAVIGSGFRAGVEYEVYEDAAKFDLRRMTEQTVAAPVEVLRELAHTGRELSYPVVAFTGAQEGLLTATDRDVFWRAFRVPVYEQFRHVDGQVVAEECDAHEGMHLRTDEAIVELRGREVVVSSLVNLRCPVLRLATGLIGDILHAACGCGRTEPRLVVTMARAAGVMKARAASA